MIETTVGRFQERFIVEEYLDDEMDALSDSRSTHFSNSRPTTPSDQQPLAEIDNSHIRSSTESEPYSVAIKASNILGLIPGTLPYAKACLQSARDEAKRLSELSSTSYTDFTYNQGSEGKGKGTEGWRRMDRAKKALSTAMMVSMGQGHRSVPSVVIGAGGKEEQEQREKRRKIADAVLHWQKEVQRLEESEARSVQATMTTKSRRR